MNNKIEFNCSFDTFSITRVSLLSPKSFLVRDEKNKATLNQLSADVLLWVAQNYVKGIHPPKNSNKTIQFLQGCCSTWRINVTELGRKYEILGKKINDLTYIWACLTFVSAVSLHNVNFATWCTSFFWF